MQPIKVTIKWRKRAHAACWPMLHDKQLLSMLRNVACAWVMWLYLLVLSPCLTNILQRDYQPNFSICIHTVTLRNSLPRILITANQPWSLWTNSYFMLFCTFYSYFYCDMYLFKNLVLLSLFLWSWLVSCMEFTEVCPENVLESSLVYMTIPVAMSTTKVIKKKCLSITAQRWENEQICSFNVTNGPLSLLWQPSLTLPAMDCHVVTYIYSCGKVKLNFTGFPLDAYHGDSACYSNWMALVVF